MAAGTVLDAWTSRCRLDEREEENGDFNLCCIYVNKERASEIEYCNLAEIHFWSVSQSASDADTLA